MRTDITTGLVAVVVIAAVVVIVFEHIRLRDIFRSLDRMLDSAIEGSFSESRYDESQLSAVENKLARYLSQCVSASRQLEWEKGHLRGLIADISHQTKTPLASIIIYAGLMQETSLTEECRGYAEALSMQAERLQFLIEELVKSGRLELGVIKVHPERGQIALCVSAAVEQTLPAANAKNISITWENTAFIAVFDPKWTLEALSNLLDNAVKYTPPGGEIKINVRRYEMFCCVDISDNGAGISEEEHGRIFERFYRSKAVRNAQGVGLGLYLAREIISAQGGYIKVKSAPDSGSTFSVFLPN